MALSDGERIGLYTVPYTASEYISESVQNAFQDIIQDIIQGVFLAAIVVFLFLRRGGSMLTICLSMPVCILAVFILMNALGLALNMLSLGGIAMGMIVDNSIVVLENITRFSAEGRDRMSACVAGTREVTSSVIASTLTTETVFIPLGTVNGQIGDMFRDFSLTIASLIGASLVISLTVVPLLCYFTLDEEKVHREQLKREAKKAAKKQPNGLILRLTGWVTAIVEREVPELEDMYYLAQEESVTLGLNLVDKDDRDRSAFDMEEDLRNALQDIAGCEITVSASSMSAMLSGDDISVEITGDDMDILAIISEDLTKQISRMPDAVNVDSTMSEQVPEVRVNLNREAASQYGLTAATIGAAVRAELTGTTATTVTIDSKELDVVVKGDGSASASLDALKSMPITSQYGGTVSLSAVANVTIEQAPQTITRYNQNRQVTITGDTISGDSTAMTKTINAILADYPLPEGYTAETSGASEDMMESFGDLGFALLIALLLVYFVLAVQFESFLLPVMVMMILPVAFTGALFALPITGRDLSVLALAAIIMLAGTEVNSSIILIEYIRIRRDMGESREEAILNACPLRVRPILMTTLTTVLAMVPMALGISGANEMMSDMGVVMISGMVISTIVTLVFTPVYYSVLDELSCSFRRRRKARRGNG